MSQNDNTDENDVRDESMSKTTRRGLLGALGVAGLASLGSGSASAQLGGGPEADAMSEYRVPTYRVPESDLDSPGVVGRRVEITSGGSSYSAGDQLVDTGSSWELINPGVGSLSTGQLDSVTQGPINRDAILNYSGGVMPDGTVADTTDRGVNAVAGRNAKWIWFVRPIAIETNSQTILGYTGGESGADNILVAKNHSTGDLTTTTLASDVSTDDHVNPAVYQRDDGHIICFWTGHNGDTMYYRISDSADDISSFGSTQTISQTSVTYPQPVQLSSLTDNPLRLHYRERAGTGDGHMYYRESTDGGVTWGSQQRLVEAPSGHYGIYFKTIRKDNGNVYYFCTDAHGATDGQKEDVRFFFYSESADAYYKSGGTKIADPTDLPLSFSDLEVVHDTDSTGRESWIYDVGLRNGNDPTAIYTTWNNSAEMDYRVSLLSNGSWFDVTVADAGSSIEARGQEPFYAAGATFTRIGTSAGMFAVTESSAGTELARYEIQSFDRGVVRKDIISVSENRAAPLMRPVSPIKTDAENVDTSVVWMEGAYADAQQAGTVLKGIPETHPTNLGELGANQLVSLGTDVFSSSDFRDGLSISGQFTTGSDVDSHQTLLTAENYTTVEIGRSGDGVLDFTLYDGSNNPFLSTPISADTDYGFDAKWDAEEEEMSLWLNGTEQTSTSFSGPIPLDDVTRNVLIGMHFSTGENTVAPWYGKDISNLKILPRATTDAESQFLSNQ